MLGGNGENVQPERELEVVDVHGRPLLDPAAGRRGLPDRRVQVVPGDDAVDADDAAVPPIGRGHATGLQHPLVVGKLQQVVPAFASRRIRGEFGRLPGRPVQTGTERGQASVVSVQAAMVFDVHRPVPGPRRGHQEIGFADPAALRVGRQPSAHDDRRPSLHRGGRRRLAFLPVRLGDHAGIRVQRYQLRDSLGLEPAARREAPLKHPRDRQRIARPDQLPLRPHRALLGQVTALWRHLRHLVARPHGTIVRVAYVSSPGHGRCCCEAVASPARAISGPRGRCREFPRAGRRGRAGRPGAGGS